MITNKTESFSATDALKAGLASAVCDGSTKIVGSYEITTRGLNFDQRVFSFPDCYGDLRFGKFACDAELFNFASAFGDLDDENSD